MKLKELPLKYSFLPLSFYYLGPICFITYLYSLKSCFAKWRLNGLLSVLLFLGFSIILLTKQDTMDAFIVLRFFWGWMFFFIFFSYGYWINLDVLLKILCFLVIGEAILINTFIAPYELPNYPDTSSNHFAPANMYQRPYSFGGSASVTSAILVTLMASLKLNFRSLLLPIAATLSCMSGTGFYLLIIYFWLQFLRLNVFLSMLLFALVIFALTSGLMWKFSSEYLELILNYKVSQLIAISKGDLSDNLLFGLDLAQTTGIGGDFQFLSFFELNGVLGLLVITIILLLNLNRHNYLPIFMMLLGSLHYGVIFYFPGQFFFGYFLALRVSSSGYRNNMQLSYMAKNV